jgi:hypothetical protein
MAKKILIENGSGTETGDTFGSFGGETTFAFVGTFDGSTCQIEVSVDGSIWSPVHDASGTAVSITAATQDVYALSVPSAMSVRATISGGGGSTDITITMVQ